MKTTDVDLDDSDTISDQEEMPVRFVIHCEYNPHEKKSGGLKCRIEPEFSTPKNLTPELESEVDSDFEIEESDEDSDADDSESKPEKTKKKSRKKSKSRKDEDKNDDSSDEDEDEDAENDEPDPILECYAKAYPDD